MKIVNLMRENSDYIDVVAKWLWQEWGKPKNFLYWKSWVESSTGIDEIPQTFVMLEDDMIVGTVSLWRCDLQSRQDICPWLGGLYIKEEYRGKGFGTLLQKHALKAANLLGYKQIYMFTVLNNYFERNGWEYLEHAIDENGCRVKLYRKDL